MNSLIISGGIFGLIVAGIVAGSWLRRTLPEQHLSKDSQDIVRLGAGLVATMGALVLGLLIAAAKTSFDTQSSQVKEITADVILLDNLLTAYGPEAQPIRAEIRQVVPPLVDRIWQEKADGGTAPFAASAAAEKIYLQLQALAPQTDTQRSLQMRAVQVSNDLAQTRVLLFAEKDNAVPLPFIAILTFWLIIIFMSFSLFAELNATVFIFLALFALSASCAIFLILELGRPFTGIMMVASEPLRNALVPLTQ